MNCTFFTPWRLGLAFWAALDGLAGKGAPPAHALEVRPSLVSADLSLALAAKGQGRKAINYNRYRDGAY